VALALALSKRPQILLLDEPLASLDPLARREFLSALVDAMSEAPMTVVLSSHLVADLERVCDHLMLLRSGRVRVMGRTEDLLATHKVLIGPGGPVPSRLSGVDQVITVSSGERQSTLLVRTSGQIADPAWEPHDATLEDVILGYLSAPDRGDAAGGGSTG
jgi:ABC-2 type transport system ATP-binding protein